MQETHGFDPCVEKIPWRRAWQPTPVFLPRESHGHRSLEGYRVHRVEKSGPRLKQLSMYACARNWWQRPIHTHTHTHTHTHACNFSIISQSEMTGCRFLQRHGIVQHLSFCDKCISQHDALKAHLCCAYIRISFFFFRLSDIPLYRYSTF